MKRRFNPLFTAATVFVGAGMLAQGAQCPNNTTLDQLILLGAAGCQSQDKIFSKFSYSGPDAAQVAATLVTSPGPNNQNLHGWSFTRTGGVWTVGFNIGFQVDVAPGNPGVGIIASVDQIDSGPTPNGTAVVDTQSAAVLNLSGTSTATETQQTNYAPRNSVTTASVVTFNGGGDFLVTYDQLFVEAGSTADVMFVNYAANLLIADSVVNITNTGVRNGFDPAGGICANLYVFDPSEEMVACCSCYVTPDGLKSVSLKQDLVSNTLTPGVPGSAVVKIIASAPVTGTNCNAATVTAANLEGGLRAWRTTIHQDTVSGNYEQTENVFLGTPISDSEFAKLTTYCGFIQSNGSGFGICKSCRLGGLGGAQK